MLKGLWNILPAIIGTFQSALPMLKELAVNVIRILDILPFEIQAEETILKVNEIFEKVMGWVEQIKNLLLIVK